MPSPITKSPGPPVGIGEHRAATMLWRQFMTSSPRPHPSQDATPSDCDRQAPRLNVELHARLMAEGRAKPSTLESAREALRQLRLRTEAETLKASSMQQKD